MTEHVDLTDLTASLFIFFSFGHNRRIKFMREDREVP